MSEGAKVAVGRGAIGKEVKHGGLTLGVEERGSGCEPWSASDNFAGQWFLNLRGQ